MSTKLTADGQGMKAILIAAFSLFSTARERVHCAESEGSPSSLAPWRHIDCSDPHSVFSFGSGTVGRVREELRMSSDPSSTRPVTTKTHEATSKRRTTNCLEGMETKMCREGESDASRSSSFPIPSTHSLHCPLKCH